MLSERGLIPNKLKVPVDRKKISTKIEVKAPRFLGKEWLFFDISDNFIRKESNKKYEMPSIELLASQVTHKNGRLNG